MKGQNVVIAERFRKAVTLHVVKNMLPSADGQVPLILGIHGPSGYGKTFQCETVLDELQVTPFVISGGELESPDAGAPARLIRSTYLQASNRIADTRREYHINSAAIIINDFDTALGDFGPLVQYTTNRQMVFVELMARADYPRMVEGRPTYRIPIIFTGNDFTKLYAPLVRAGRMTAFEWIPTTEETKEIVHTIFPDLSLSDLHRLISKYADEPIAMYSTLRSLLLDDHLYGIIQKEGPRRVMDYVRSGKEIVRDREIDYDEIVRKADDLIKQGVFVNHLGRREK